MLFAPLQGWRRVAVTDRRTRADWARVVKELVDQDYPDKERIVLVMDNLNTHHPASLYEAFEPSEARRIAERLEIHYTPKHGSWLNMAEIEIGVLDRQCLSRRIPDQEVLRREVAAWQVSDARTMDQATAVLQDFLPRYNARFAVQPEHPEPAYRPADPDLTLSEILCFKDTRKVGRDNTVKYHWRVLQLLPDRERTSYAGLRVEMLERPNGQLIVRYEGRRVATQEPPPRMGALWAGATAWSPGPELRRVVSSVGDHHISRSQQGRLAALEPVRPAEPVLKPVASKPVAGKDAAAKDIASKALNPWERTPTPTQLARWKAIQKGRLKGLSLRAISRELGISRVTVRKYAYAEKPPTKKLSAEERAKLLALRKSTTVAS